MAKKVEPDVVVFHLVEISLSKEEVSRALRHWVVKNKYAENFSPKEDDIFIRVLSDDDGDFSASASYTVSTN